MQKLLIEAELRDLRNTLKSIGASENEITIIISEMKQDTCSVVGNFLTFNN